MEKWKLYFSVLSKDSKNVIKAGYLMCDAVYLKILSNLKRWYTSYEDQNEGGETVRLDNVIIIDVKVKSINYVVITARAQNHSIGDTFRLGAVWVCYDANDEILGTMFWSSEWNYYGFVLEGEVGSSDDKNEGNEDLFYIWYNWPCLKINVLK